ncbi:MAG TPA: hypothetical protein VFQ53_13330 [Kofleriaceae bacterium]|nr:hypothetical protein [Kofleriaceae bacterium]
MRAFASAIVLAAVVGVASAQPAPADLARAKELYQSAETAMAQSRFDDAARDYAAAYDLSKDPVLFFKIGSAHQKAGKCDIAVVYYRRYLKEGAPAEPFATTTRERITACGGDKAPEPAPPEPMTTPAPPPTPEPAATTTPTEPPAPAKSTALPARHRLAWLLVGGSIASFTVGAVLAYSANAAENDVDDLYVGLGGIPPAYDARTKARLDELIDEGERYELLSRIGFGVAGALAIGATIRFLTDPDAAETPAKTSIVPTVSPRGAGVAATIRF